MKPTKKTPASGTTSFLNEMEVEKWQMTSPTVSLSYQARREVLAAFLPRYRAVSSAQKSLLLDSFVQMTGYARTSAIRLLNHPPEHSGPIRRPRLPIYGAQVQQALVVAWKAAAHICAKRLIPFLPALVAALERHGHLQLSEESRSHLLAMSVSTAQRLLHTQRKPTPQGLGTTKAGPLLKDQIAVRTSQQWDEERPGFVEADLVAHCGGDIQGSYLCTLTLTDIATGWTECLPLLFRSPEAVLAALEQARARFPFPILGLDTDNGGEFINAALQAYCEREQLTFTRGRPEVKNDQCFVEEKNGAIVRRFVGYTRLAGAEAYGHLRELYRALHLYVNCFQPSMKLLSKDRSGATVRRLYDPAKTPLERLLLAGALTAQKQQELRAVGEALDPVALLNRVQQLQRALWGSAKRCPQVPFSTISPPLLQFSSPACGADSMSVPAAASASAPAMEHVLEPQPGDRSAWLRWSRTTRDPFAGQWEGILDLVLAHPEWSSGQIFQELQRRSAGRYHPSQLGTLHRGPRLIRARLLPLLQEPWQAEVIQAERYDAREADPHLEEQEQERPAGSWSTSATFPAQKGTTAAWPSPFRPELAERCAARSSRHSPRRHLGKRTSHVRPSRSKGRSSATCGRRWKARGLRKRWNGTASLWGSSQRIS